MKSINSFINESRKGWTLNTDKQGLDFGWTKSCSFIWMNTDSEEVGFLSETEVRSFGEDYGDEETVEKVLELKPGEMYDPDGINYYIRFK